VPRKPKDDNSTPKDETRPNSTGELADKGNWVGFINVNLSDDEKTYFKQWVLECADDILPALYEVVDDGLKFSLAADPANDCYLATFTGKGLKKFPLFVAAMSARGQDPEQAIALLVYKQTILCEHDWSKFWKEKRGFGSEI